MASGRYNCLVCGQSEACPRGSATLCFSWDTHTPGGVCAGCLKAYTMDGIVAAPEFAKLLTPLSAAEAILLQTAVAKAKVDSDFCLDDYLDEAGLREAYEYALD